MFFIIVYYYNSKLVIVIVTSYHFFLLLSFTLIYGAYHQCLFNTCQEESSGNGINRRYENSCLYWEDFTLDFETLTNYTNKKYKNLKTNAYFSYSCHGFTPFFYC